MELVVKELQTLALISPHVSFAFDNLGKDRDGQPKRTRVLSLPKVNCSNLSLGMEIDPMIEALSLLKTPSLLHSFREIYGRALVEVSQHIVSVDSRLCSH